MDRDFSKAWRSHPIRETLRRAATNGVAPSSAEIAECDLPADLEHELRAAADAIADRRRRGGIRSAHDARRGADEISVDLVRRIPSDRSGHIAADPDGDDTDAGATAERIRDRRRTYIGS